MKLNILPFSSGLQWWLQALRLFIQKPSVFFGMGCLSFLLTFFVLLFPLIGTLLYGVAYILSSMLFMLCTDAFIRQQTPVPTYFIQSIFKNPNKVFGKILALGLLFSILFIFAIFVTLMLSRIFNPDGIQFMLETTMAGAQNLNEITAEKLEVLARAFLWAISLLSLFSIFILVLFLFTPALVYWHRASAIKALFFNGFAVVKNFKPMLCYSLTLCVFALACTIVTAIINALLFTLLPNSSLGLAIQSLVMFFISTSFFALFQISIYIAFKKCFTVTAS